MPAAPARRPHRSLFAALFCALLLLAGCAQLPPLDGRPPSQLEADTGATRLGRGVQAAAAGHAPGESGVFLLEQGRDAFATRVLLAEAAERTLDVQYYIWRDDMSGRLLFDALRRAADRGVRVRLLLDDLGSSGLDAVLAALDAHPRIEVRLFNPFVQRQLKPLGFLTDFMRSNRRMHNKSFTADNQATVVGGRNVGDEYFGAEVDTLFVDLDVLAIGPVVQAVSEDFDRYWASGSAYPLALLLQGSALLADAAPPGPPVLDALPERTIAYLDAVARSSFVAELVAARLPLHWASVELVSDDPAKGLGLAADEDLLFARMRRLVDTPAESLHLVSPYFVPTARGAAMFGALAARGVEVAVLTNALEATDVAVVHAGYIRWREPLLRAGVRLYEMRRQPGPPAAGEKRHVGSSSAESLHAKTFVVDRRQLFVGSFNFDPRSARLNTELGFVIDSPALAAQLDERLRTQARQRSYRLQLGPQGQLQWLDSRAEPPLVLEQEPGTSLWQRLGVRALSWLPIDWLL
ncbi:phospholipase D family protein [Pseudorhodoferax sp.]|uniref:phospholipase D family protein n=1 Tax=Pseudorhodoferax sp. TaxID=1993553 RepID=UPI002DD678CE|nr:phospholipase D family protein [Pseudorhodoferax sp.]